MKQDMQRLIEMLEKADADRKTDKDFLARMEADRKTDREEIRTNQAKTEAGHNEGQPRGVESRPRKTVTGNESLARRNPFSAA
jgi:hypothetical protein